MVGSIEYFVVFSNYLLDPSRWRLLDLTYNSMGFSHPVDPYQPLLNNSIPLQDWADVFAKWVLGYFTYGSIEEGLERRTALAEPLPMISRITLDKVNTYFSPKPASPGGSNFSIYKLRNHTTINSRMRKHALCI